MKKFIPLFTILLIFVSCKTSKGASCDAYSQNIKKTDIKSRTDKQSTRQDVYVYQHINR